MFFALVLSVFLTIPEEPYVLWLTNQKTMKVKAAPRCQGATCTLTLLNGEITSLPSRLVDMGKSETYNREMAQKREEARALREAMAKEAELAAATEEDEPKKKVIKLTSEDTLPTYDRASATTTGEVDRSGEKTEDNTIVGEPKVKTFSSQDPIFLSKETVTRYQNHSSVTCEVTVNHEGGAENIVVDIKVSFETAAATSLKRRVPGKYSQGEKALVTFKIDVADDILRTTYQLAADMASP